MISTARYRLHLCFGPNCSRFNPKELLKALEDELQAQGLEEDVSIQLSACRNRCEQSPSLNVYPGPIFYNRLTPDAIRAIHNGDAVASTGASIIICDTRTA